MKPTWMRGSVLAVLVLSLGCGGGGGGSSPTAPTSYAAFFDVYLENTAGGSTLQASTLFIDGERIGQFSATSGTVEARMDTTVVKEPGAHNVRVVLDQQAGDRNRYRLHGTVTFRDQVIDLPVVAGQLSVGDGLATDVVLP